MDFSMMSILWRHRESMPTQNISCFRAKTQKSDRKTGLIHPFNGLIQQSPHSGEREPTVCEAEMSVAASTARRCVGLRSRGRKDAHRGYFS